MSGQRMNAIVFEGPGKLSYREVDRPACGADEAVVRIHRIGICGTDVEMFRGHIHKAEFPIIPGHEWTGEIVETGSAVRGFRVGDRVVGETTIACGRCSLCKNGRYHLCLEHAENGIFGRNGAACEYMAFPAASLHKLNDRISYDQACLIEPAAVVFRGLEKMKLSPRDVVAVVGPGTIGLLSVVLAKHFGARKVVLVGFQPQRLALGRALGADETVDLGREDYVSKALEATDGELFSAIVEASGSAEACENLFQVAAPGGKVCLLGSYGKQLPRIDATKIVDYDMTVHGSLSSPGVWDAVVRWMEATPAEVTRLISHHFPLSRYRDALQLLEDKDPSAIKVMIHPASDDPASP